ncbi:hypothetical protein SAMN05660909_00864 [Chitinophaga terrae (ex Kim and Jung 2007)]|uniref:FAS1 domain-containing protein n=1 Tax=Chitinophaga terrae (ex Kim and Jung 2007) TaxID=408074 RepID=A0A1H3YMQ5_9BACT|nr:hypothetical protein [Chitinophaga terrae (ex Kim and Jung 2007)]SEA12783.1 hypothetical protein SAMN05660909_00864 [Chitinophaga terrae (ex Kim and Jung 2007)]
MQFKKFFIHTGWMGLLAIVLLASCRKEHYLGGSPTNAHTDLSTYDYLKANPLFDTLILLIDKAGLKEMVNGQGTFVAPTDYSIKRFLNTRTTELQKQTNNENIKYTIDSLKVPELRDSLMTYLFDAGIQRAGLSTETTVFKSKVNEQFGFKIIYAQDDVISAGVPLMYMSKIINGVDPSPLPSDFPDTDKDKEYVLQTTGILTKNGVLHVLSNAHTFYWK